MAIKKGLIHVTDSNGNVVDVHPETEISQVEGLTAVLNNKANISDIPTKTSQLTNNSGFITKAVNNLDNYYKKSDTYTQEEINDLISALPKFNISVVSSLPTDAISPTTIYLVKTADTTGNLYTEYIYINNTWEELGTQDVNLTGYATTEWTTTQINNAKQELNETINNSSTDLVDSINNKADAEHTHVSDDIISLPNYSKPLSSGSISTSDSLNTALGKLEKALDGKQPVGNYLSVTDAAAKALADSEGNNIIETYATKESLNDKLDADSSDFVKSISISGTSITVTKGDDTTDTLLTQDTTYPTATITELSEGTDETGKLVSPKLLKEFVMSEIVGGVEGVQLITSGSENGTISVDGVDVLVTGLGSAAFADSGDYASTNHVHGSNEITLMTDYTIADESEAIEDTDTLNQAIGKLEKGLSEKLDITNVPVNISDLNDDIGILTDVSWNNISDIPSNFTPSPHNQPASTIGAMTGYEKLNDTTDITTTDSLNQAISKLESKLDLKANNTDIPDVSNFITSVSWNDIQNVPTDFTPESHTHVGTEVTLTGYVKPDTVSAIEATDNVNEAIGKLETALDNVQESLPAMTAAEATTGTSTEVRVISPKVLNDFVVSKTEHTHNVATTTSNGFMSSADKSKLDNLVGISVSDDATMPQSVDVNNLWIQIVGNSAIENSETTQF